MFNTLKKQVAEKLMSSLPERTSNASSSKADAEDVDKAMRFINSGNGVSLHKMDSYQAFLEVGYLRVWATFRALHLKASVVLGTNIFISGEAREAIARDDASGEVAELYELLDSPNPYDSWEDVIYQWVFHMGLTGNAFWVKDRINGLGQPRDLYPLLPQYVKIVTSKKKKISHYLYKVDGREQRYEPDEIIHFKRPHPNCLVTGMGDIEPSQDIYSSYINNSNLYDNFLENGAQPSGLLIKEEYEEDEDAWKLMKKQFDKRYAGRRNVGKTGWMHGGKWKYVRLGLTQQEMQAIEREKWSVEQIFLNHGIPLTVAGLSEGGQFVSVVDDRRFRRYEIKPLLDILVGKLNKGNELVKTFGDKLRIGYNLSGLEDVEQITRDFEPLVRNGAMTPNEFREKTGLRKSDNPALDLFYLNGIPLELAGFGSLNDSEIRNIQEGSP